MSDNPPAACDRDRDHEDGQPDEASHDVTRIRPMTSLRFAVRFRPSDSDAAAESQSPPERSHPNSYRSLSPDPHLDLDPCSASLSTQSINLTFQDGFKSSLDSPLGILVRADRTVRNLVLTDADNPDAEYDDGDTEVDDLARSLQHICVVDEPINLFPPPACPSVSARWPSIFNHPFAIAIPIALLLALLLPLPLQQLPAGLLSRDTPYRSSSPHAAGPSIVVRHAPLTIFDQLLSLLHHHIDAPLPLVVGAQDIVDKHYLVYPHVHTHGVPRQPRNVTVSVFVADIVQLSSSLCDAVSSWAISARSPLRQDLELLCRAISTAGLELPSLLGYATAHFSSLWPSTLTRATLQLAMAVQELPMEGRAPGLPENGGTRDNSSTEPAEQVVFYNATAQTFLRELSTACLRKHRHRHHAWSAGSEELPPFPAAIYEGSQAIEAVENATSTIVTHLGLLLAILRDEENVLSAVEAQRGHPPQDKDKARPFWFWKPEAPPASASNKVARVATAYNNVIPLHYTCTALLWAMAFAREKVNGVVRDLETLGNYTESLLAADLPSSLKHDDIDAALPWWRGTPWVTESNGGKAERLIRTYSYLPSGRDVSLAMEELEALGRQEARRSQADLNWALRETEAFWHGHDG